MCGVGFGDKTFRYSYAPKQNYSYDEWIYKRNVPIEYLYFWLIHVTDHEQEHRGFQGKLHVYVVLVEPAGTKLKDC